MSKHLIRKKLGKDPTGIAPSTQSAEFGKTVSDVEAPIPPQSAGFLTPHIEANRGDPSEGNTNNMLFPDHLSDHIV